MGTSIEDSSDDEFFTDLNREQILAVRADPSQHTLVLAGAGCGKTTVLTRRIAYLVRKCYKPESILALTFTRKAAREMASRVLNHAEVSGCSALPLITTFHGFALGILSETFSGQKNFSRISFNEDSRLISEQERMAILAEVSTSEQRRALGLDIMELDSLLARYEVFPQQIQGFDNEKIDIIRTVSEKSTKARQARGLWDFSDLLIGCLNLFGCFPELHLHYKERFKAILVDEFQDTNPIQIELLRMLISDTTRLFAVGDDDQAIYGFRGADIGPTINFRQVFENAQIVKLQTNYRNAPLILSFSNRIFKSKDPQYRKILVSGKKPQKNNNCCLARRRFENQECMVQWVAKKARKLSYEQGIAVSSMAMLFRENQSISITESLVKKNEPAISDITMMTIHKSKGLEFPVVFLCDLEETTFPSYRIPDNRKIHSFSEFIVELFKKRKPVDCDWDEEKRLFYVAVTRAKQYLYLLSVNKKQVYGRSRSFSVSRFFKYR